MIPIILSGGSGTRLWPLSRSQHPKQFLPLASNKTMVQETLLRLEGIENLQPPLGICNEDHRFMMAEQMREIGSQPKAIILEPVGKNTAPAVCLAALSVNPDDILLVLPADHVITDIANFQETVNNAKKLAELDYLVTFGVKPTYPETGYGYIEVGNTLDFKGREVSAFFEKPDTESAQQYIENGNYYWNSGMFAFKAKTFLDELAIYQPEILSRCQQAMKNSQRDLDFIRIDKDSFLACPSDSIDYAVMEKTQKGALIPLNAGWNDIGSWSALWDVTNKDENGNASVGKTLSHETHNSLLYAHNKMITTVGVSDLIIIETEDAVLISAKDKVQDVKTLVDQLKADNQPEAHQHPKVYRPWGYYHSIDNGERHQTKHIVVKPGAKLSLQKHNHRAEHWIVVKGTAIVTKNEEQLLLTENESTYIPLGVKHCLENPGVIPLEIIEVQSGSYLGEDDIVRYQDNYGRETAKT